MGTFKSIKILIKRIFCGTPENEVKVVNLESENKYLRQAIIQYKRLYMAEKMKNSLREYSINQSK